MKPLKALPGSKIFNVPLYGWPVVFCTSRAAYTRYIELLDGEVYEVDGFRGVSHHVKDKRSKSHFMVGWFDSAPSTLIHELTHTTFAVLAHAEVKFDADNHEAFAYLMDALYTESMRVAKALRKR